MPAPGTVDGPCLSPGGPDAPGPAPSRPPLGRTPRERPSWADPRPVPHTHSRSAMGSSSAVSRCPRSTQYPRLPHTLQSLAAAPECPSLSRSAGRTAATTRRVCRWRGRPAERGPSYRRHWRDQSVLSKTGQAAATRDRVTGQRYRRDHHDDGAGHRHHAAGRRLLQRGAGRETAFPVHATPLSVAYAVQHAVLPLNQLRPGPAGAPGGGRGAGHGPRPRAALPHGDEMTAAPAAANTRGLPRRHNGRRRPNSLVSHRHSAPRPSPPPGQPLGLLGVRARLAEGG